MRTCGTKERRAANMAKFGYIMDNDPRYNGEHAAMGYDVDGPDPCDPNNNPGWLKTLGLASLLYVLAGKGGAHSYIVTIVFNREYSQHHYHNEHRVERCPIATCRNICRLLASLVYSAISQLRICRVKWSGCFVFS